MRVELFAYNARQDEINKMSYAELNSAIEYYPRGLFDPLNPIFDNVFIGGANNKINMCRFEWRGLTYVCSCQVYYSTASNLYRIEGHVDPAATMYNIDGYKYCYFWFDRTPQSLSIPYEYNPSAQISPYISARKDIIGRVAVEDDSTIYYILRVGGVNKSDTNTISLDDVYIVNRTAITLIAAAFTSFSSTEAKLYSDSIKSLTKLSGFNLNDYFPSSVPIFTQPGKITLHAIANSAQSASIQFSDKVIDISGVPGADVLQITAGYASRLYKDFALNEDIYKTKYEYDLPIIFNYGNIITCSTSLTDLGISALNSGNNYNVWRVGFRVWYDIYGGCVYCAPLLRDVTGITTVWVEGMASAELPNIHSWFSVASESGVSSAEMNNAQLGIGASLLSSGISAATGNIAGTVAGVASTVTSIIDYGKMKTFGGAVGQAPGGSSGQYRSIVSNAIYIMTFSRSVTENAKAANYITGYIANLCTEGQPSEAGVYRCQRFEFSGREVTKGYPPQFIEELTAQMQNFYYLSFPTNAVAE